MDRRLDSTSRKWLLITASIGLAILVIQVVSHASASSTTHRCVFSIGIGDSRVSDVSKGECSGLVKAAGKYGWDARVLKSTTSFRDFYPRCTLASLDDGPASRLTVYDRSGLIAPIGKDFCRALGTNGHWSGKWSNGKRIT